MHAIAHVSLSYHTISILYSVKEFIDAPSLDERSIFLSGRNRIPL